MDYQLPLVPPEFYSIDTNVFIDIWSPPEGNIYSKERMPELWELIVRLVEEGKIVATKEVYDELERHAVPELYDWLQEHKDMFIFDMPQVQHAQMIINEFYSIYKDGYKPEVNNGADPFVVALAMTHNAVVITQERPQDPHIPAEVNVPRIPTVCDNYGIKCVNIEKFIQREGFRVAMVEAVAEKVTAEKTNDKRYHPIMSSIKADVEKVV